MGGCALALGGTGSSAAQSLQSQESPLLVAGAGSPVRSWSAAFRLVLPECPHLRKGSRTPFYQDGGRTSWGSGPRSLESVIRLKLLFEGCTLDTGMHHLSCGRGQTDIC